MPPVFFILLHFHMDNQNKVNDVCFICILYCTLSHLYTQKHNDIHKLTRIMQRKKKFCFILLSCIVDKSYTANFSELVFHVLMKSPHCSLGKLNKAWISLLRVLIASCIIFRASSAALFLVFFLVQMYHVKIRQYLVVPFPDLLNPENN